MSWTSDLLVGIAETLAAAGVGVWRPDGLYTTDEVGVFIAYMPPGGATGPDRCIVLTDYDPAGGNSAGDVTPRVQVRCRGARNDPVSAIDLASDARDALDGLAFVTFGQVTVSQINHINGTPMGVDGNGRHERSDNYDIQAQRTSALLTE
ncbi:minor capsid protein [Glycomyces arizonensis]|uniref:minor capsid protein n=1 Tax=Glycomyces arizonensis TaxID=256035 RepID=UPI000405BF95|nr:minor capsid protein [Glycomyces arizonensis]